MKAKLLTREIGRGRQDVIYTEVYSQGDFKLRIRIRSDAYKFQSYAIAEIWNPTELKWNDIASIHYSQMYTVEGLIHYPSQDEASLKMRFTADCDVLKGKVEKILF